MFSRCQASLQVDGLSLLDSIPDNWRPLYTCPRKLRAVVPFTMCLEGQEGNFKYGLQEV